MNGVNCTSQCPTLVHYTNMTCNGNPGVGNCKYKLADASGPQFTCETQCPTPYFVDNDTCVSACLSGRTYVYNGTYCETQNCYVAVPSFNFAMTFVQCCPAQYPYNTSTTDAYGNALYQCSSTCPNAILQTECVPSCPSDFPYQLTN
jgi:hypothetical protein